MPSPNPNKSGEDSSDKRAQSKGSSPFISSPTSAPGGISSPAVARLRDDANVVRQSSTPATVLSSPSHSPSPAIPHFTGALTANLNTFVNAGTAVGRLIARGEATLQTARTQNREDPFGAEAGPSNSPAPEQPWILDPFSSSSSGGPSVYASLPSLPRPSPALDRTGSLLRTSRVRVRIEDSPRVALNLSSQADADTVVPAPAPPNSIVSINPGFPPAASRGPGHSRGGSRNITVPAGPRPMPMGCANSSATGAHRNFTDPSASRDARAQMPPPPPPHREIPIRRPEPTQAPTGRTRIWGEDTPPINDSDLFGNASFFPPSARVEPLFAISGDTSSYPPSARVPPLFARRQQTRPIAPLRPPTIPTWQPDSSRPASPPRQPPSEASSDHPSPIDLELQLEILEQQQHQQLLILQQHAWEREVSERQEQLRVSRLQYYSARLQPYPRLQQYQRQKRESPDVVSATQYATPGSGQFYYEPRVGSIVRPAPMVDPFVRGSGGGGNGWVNNYSGDLYFPPPRADIEDRLTRRQRRRRAMRDQSSPSPGAYDEPERMLGESRREGGESEAVTEVPAAVEVEVQVREDEEGHVTVEVTVEQGEDEDDSVSVEVTVEHIEEQVGYIERRRSI